ncbi:MAG: 6-phosphofructokinase [Flavobacteriales bacterium]|nr:6-phosphofructokinase [Flavobacteriales bacterium]
MNDTIRKIGVLTSGGDAPGMNAGLRAVVRSCHYYNIECIGIRRGYAGMMEGDMDPIGLRDVNRIINRGGTIIQSSRCEAFRHPEGRSKAFAKLQEWGLDALVIIGGNGSFAGAQKLNEEHGIPIVGLPGTIDNDLYGSDYTIGFDTATNTVIDAVDKLRDTARSHDRIFFVEVMGRDSGFIALKSGLATGAIAILLPEEDLSIDELVVLLERNAASGKTSSIVIVAEGDANGGAFTVAEKVKRHMPHLETRVTVLGHIQRGGSPTCADRVLASRLGVAAVEALRNGMTNVMAGIINDEVVYTPLEEVFTTVVRPSAEEFRVSKIISI